MSAKSFVGTWRLVSFEARTSSGDVRHPIGKDAVGFLIYNEDGYMAVAVMRANRANFSTADVSGGTSEEKVAAFDSYSSYCGTYEVKGSKIIHHVECSQLPNWSGNDQERFFEFSDAGDRLRLSTSPILASGVEQTFVATWQRVKP